MGYIFDAFRKLFGRGSGTPDDRSRLLGLGDYRGDRPYRPANEGIRLVRPAGKEYETKPEDRQQSGGGGGGGGS